MSVFVVLVVASLIFLFVPLILAPILLADRDAASLVQLPE